MVLRYSIVHVLGLHNRIRVSKQVNSLVQLSVHDIGRISKHTFGFRPVIVQDMTSLFKEIQQKKNNVILVPMTTSLIYKDAPLIPLYNMNPPTEVSYRNFYFYIPGIGHERVQNIECQDLLKQMKMPSIPEYPIAGTEMQKENLLRKYLC